METGWYGSVMKGKGDPLSPTGCNLWRLESINVASSVGPGQDAENPSGMKLRGGYKKLTTERKKPKARILRPETQRRKDIPFGKGQ